jgi:5-methylcytosine-specific restriction endonuclease McrA
MEKRYKEILMISAVSLGLLAVSFCAFPEWLKKLIRKEQNNCCDWCGKKVKKLQIHHIIPQSMGGSDERSNAVGLCQECHSYWDKEALKYRRLYPKK